MNKVIQMIADERQRQIEKEGFTNQHDDDMHSEDNSLAKAAACYLLKDTDARAIIPDYHVERLLKYKLAWPWDSEYWKPKDKISNLVRSAALIVAEIEREHRRQGIESPAPPVEGKTAEEVAMTFGLCSCDKAFTDRRLTAPDCPWHAYPVEEAMHTFAASQQGYTMEQMKDCFYAARQRVNESWFKYADPFDYLNSLTNKQQ